MTKCLIVLLSLALGSQASAASRGVTPSELIKAAKAASVGDIDDAKKSCDDDRSVQEWLSDTVGKSARSIRWSGGACKLVFKDNPRDAGTQWCARADVVPKKGGPPATIEVTFDRPKGGRPGKPLAFRATVKTKDGWDYMRETSAFEANWGETYIADYKPPDDACN
jgi:hypothetical protein